MRHGRPTLLFLFFLLIGFSAEAQRGGRNDGSNRRPNPRERSRESDRGGDLSNLKFQDRLWYGAGGTFFYSGVNQVSVFTLGLMPQVGYKFTDFLSAGPRFGVTNTFVRNFAVFEDNPGRNAERRRYSLLDYSAGGFVRARYRALYVQGEYSVLSFQYAPFFPNTGGAAVIDINDEVIKRRQSDSQLQLGVGYNPSQGGVGSDIGIYYNLFDDVNSVRSAIELRVMLTFNY